ncbi:hypothetical protein FDP41_004025 [Naegleria fowleri]|uniref:Peptidase S8/S53 domain-containing protein n=1 Tax=Naegleria fowleri TaxID=5763 RepID=A0A6A5BSF2_NAEFO|nr:uncharacterized protein FDP41_004025 [Naegleria fowleri]KAF0976730.1 hypothetical protein FDP41_004025 [Naegleria fowleri]
MPSSLPSIRPFGDDTIPMALQEDVMASPENKRTNWIVLLTSKRFVLGMFAVLLLSLVFSYLLYSSNYYGMITQGSHHAFNILNIFSEAGGSSDKLHATPSLNIYNSRLEMNERNNIISELRYMHQKNIAKRRLNVASPIQVEHAVQYYVKFRSVETTQISSKPSSAPLTNLQHALFNTLQPTPDTATLSSVNTNSPPPNNEEFHRVSKLLEHFIIGTVSSQPKSETTSPGIIESISSLFASFSSSMSATTPSGTSVVVIMRAKPSQIADLASKNLEGIEIEWIGRVDSTRHKTALDFGAIQKLWEQRQGILSQQHNMVETSPTQQTLEAQLEKFTRFESVNANMNRQQRALSSSMLKYVSIYATVIHSLDATYQGTVEQETDELVEELNQALKNHFSERLKMDQPDSPLFYPVMKESKDKLSFAFSPSIASEAMQILLKHEGIFSVERQLPLELMNYHPNTVLQGINANLPLPPRNNTNFFIWSNGITGKGEVVGCADTGIDWDGCFFYDPENEVPLNIVNMKHRKIVSYQTVALKDQYGNIHSSDNKDSGDGHGTHVSGSIAGSILSTASNAQDMSKYNGAAPGAKLFFTDILRTGGNQLLIPPDLYNNLFKIPYQRAGVRIHSNSWGCSFSSIFNCKYNCNCKWAIDSEYGKKDETVSNDFCMKNFGKSCCQICNSYDSKSQEIDKFTWDNDDFLPLFAAGNEGYTSDSGNIGSPTTSKNVLSVGASQTTNEGFVEAVDHVDFTGVFAAIKVSTEEECCNFQGTSDDQTNLVKSLCCSSYMKKIYSENKKYFTKENLAYFSGRGPAVGNRIKPDVVAPGYEIESMHSDGSVTSFQCSAIRPTPSNSAAILTLRGTSMSTPLLAGTAALVREYLKTRSAQRHSNPSGALVKGVLIHSAQPLKGLVSLDGRGGMFDLRKLDTPNSYQGFGLVSLSSALAFEGSSFVLFTQDRKTITNHARDTYCFKRVTGKSPSQGGDSFFSATLTWYDLPSTVFNVELIQDLDLNGYVYAENSTSSTRYPGNGNSKNDHENNVEKIMISSIDKDMIVAVTVYANKLIQNQNYSLVITYSDDIEPIGWCNPPAAYSPPISVLTVLVLFGVLSSVAIIVIGGIVLLVRRFKYGGGSSGTSTSTTTSTPSGGRRLGNGENNDNSSWAANIGRRLRDGLRIGDITQTSRPQPAVTETHPPQNNPSSIMAKHSTHTPPEWLMEKMVEGMKLLQEKIEKLDNKMDRLETRMDRVESRMDKFETRLDKFESNLGMLCKLIRNQEFEKRMRTRQQQAEEGDSAMESQKIIILPQGQRKLEQD